MNVPFHKVPHKVCNEETHIRTPGDPTKQPLKPIEINIALGSRFSVLRVEGEDALEEDTDLDNTIKDYTGMEKDCEEQNTVQKVKTMKKRTRRRAKKIQKSTLNAEEMVLERSDVPSLTVEDNNDRVRVVSDEHAEKMQPEDVAIGDKAQFLESVDFIRMAYLFVVAAMVLVVFLFVQEVISG